MMMRSETMIAEEKAWFTLILRMRLWNWRRGLGLLPSTCHDSRHLAMEAGEAGVDYVAFGAFYPTSTKETVHRPDPGIIGWWVTLFGTPCVAIGGITPENAAPLVAAGADFIAVSSAVWTADDPAAAVRAFGEVMRHVPLPSGRG